MVDMLRKYSNAIGFLTLSTIHGSRAPIPFLALDGVAPTKENVAAGKYPLVTEYALVHRKGALPPEAREFIDFLLSGEGKKSLSDHGLVPVAK
jgi:phosphate transport system substrate-binding protein